MTSSSTSTAQLPTLIRHHDHLGVLRHIRAQNLREPKLVIKHATMLLGDTNTLDSNLLAASLSTLERLSALEQLLLAALDVNDADLAERCLKSIRKTPGVPADSVRIRRLVGRCLELDNDPDSIAEATALYDDLLHDNAANSDAGRRQYTLFKMQSHKETEARQVLYDYLQTQPADAAAWMEMYACCMDAGDYKGAAYAMEEVLLASPLDANLHCLLGEVYATIGGTLNNLLLGRKHLSMSLELKSPERGNLRALYSLIAVSSSFLEECANVGKKRETELENDMEVAKELIRFGVDKILPLYTNNGTKLAKVVNDVLKQQTESL